MKKNYVLLIASALLLALSFGFSACSNENEDDMILGGNKMLGDYLKNVENLTGTLHYDKEVHGWYAEDKGQVRYYFLNTLVDTKTIIGKEEGKTIMFSGRLRSVGNKWLKEHKSYQDLVRNGKMFVVPINGDEFVYRILE